MGESIDANGTEFWVERRGSGRDVLLIAGLGDPAEAWQAQLAGLANHYRLTAFDNRGAGRTPMPDEPLAGAMLADDAAALLRAVDIPSAHVAGFSMEAPSRRSWRSGIPSSSAASCSSARTLARTPSSAPCSTSGAGCRR
jgi:pimeloyl-ACP methyl ester carboxylesterase